tara:strand:- start:918 stop:1304 length:387 start_codon:yes stop_codon:yes gene_type:complete
MWEYVEDLFLQGREYWEEYYTLAHIKAHLCAGNMQLWLVGEDYTYHLAVLTEFHNYPRKRELNLLWIGGERLALGLDQLEFIELWASRFGATAVNVKGRIGWCRVLGGLGYDMDAVVLKKDISHVREH